MRNFAATVARRSRDDTLLPFDLPAVGRKKLTVDFDGGNHPLDPPG
jgi:hypothetical protein